MYSLSILLAILAASSLVSSATIKPRNIGLDEILVFGAGGRHEIVKRADFEAELARTNTTIGRPDSPFDDADSWESPLDSDASNSTDIKKRCSVVRDIVRNRDVEFLDWDIPMSSAFWGNGPRATVSVTPGYSVSDSITVSNSVDLVVIEKFMSVNVGISFTRTWTSQYSVAYTATVPEGKWGMIVSNPRVYRRSGFAKTGCIGSQRSTYFQADQHFSNDFQGLSWVQGTIGLCARDKYPIQKCIGNGFNH